MHQQGTRRERTAEEIAAYFRRIPEDLDSELHRLEIAISSALRDIISADPRIEALFLVSGRDASALAALTSRVASVIMLHSEGVLLQHQQRAATAADEDTEAREEDRAMAEQAPAAPAATPNSIQFSPEAYQQLQEMARRRGKTISETIREALGLDLWWERQLDSGYSIQIRREDGAVKTVALPDK